MSKEEDRLLRNRALRNRARSVLDQQLALVKADLDARGVGARAAHTVAEEARQVADRGASVARESKGVIAGITGAVVVWMFRKPLWAQIKGLPARFSKLKGQEDRQDGESDGE